MYVEARYSKNLQGETNAIFISYSDGSQKVVIIDENSIEYLEIKKEVEEGRLVILPAIDPPKII